MLSFTDSPSLSRILILPDSLSPRALSSATWSWRFSWLPFVKGTYSTPSTSGDFLLGGAFPFSCSSVFHSLGLYQLFLPHSLLHLLWFLDVISGLLTFPVPLNSVTHIFMYPLAPFSG